MNEVTLLPVKPGTLNQRDKAALRKAGVIVIEHDKPDELRLLRPGVEIESNQLLACAMKALKSNFGIGADSQREEFTNAVAAAILHDG